MVAVARERRSQRSVPAWHQAFLALLPRICDYARVAFRHLDPESKQEAVQSVVASALVNYLRLVQLDKADNETGPIGFQ